MDTISTLLVDDEPDIRMPMRLTIATADEGVWVCGEASDGQDAVSMVGSVRPDVVRAVAAG